MAIQWGNYSLATGITQFKGENMGESNHLVNARLEQPEKLGNIVDIMFAQKKLSTNNTLLAELRKKQTKKITLTKGNTYTWDLAIPGNIHADIIEDVGVGVKRGRNFATFKVKFKSDEWQTSQVFLPYYDNEIYQIKIVNRVGKHGKGYVYECQGQFKNANQYIPKRLFQTGQKWVAVFSAVGEGATEGTGVRTGGKVTFKGEIGKMRKKYFNTDYASTQTMAYAIKDHTSGKIFKMWSKYSDFLMLQAKQREKEYKLWFSLATAKGRDATGRPTRDFAGISSQIADGHDRLYNHLTANYLRKLFNDLLFGKADPTQPTELVGYTGRVGLENFHDAMVQYQNSLGVVNNIEVHINDTKSKLHSNSKKIGSQYTRYEMPNGINITMKWNSIFDDTKLFGQVDPLTGYPTKSSEIIFLDLEGGDGSNNIVLVDKKGGETYTYINGTYGPMGPVSQGSEDIDGYKLVCVDHVGGFIKDPSKCVRLRLERAVEAELLAA